MKKILIIILILFYSGIVHKSSAAVHLINIGESKKFGNANEYPVKERFNTQINWYVSLQTQNHYGNQYDFTSTGLYINGNSVGESPLMYFLESQFFTLKDTIYINDIYTYLTLNYGYFESITIEYEYTSLISYFPEKLDIWNYYKFVIYSPPLDILKTSTCSGIFNISDFINDKSSSIQDLNVISKSLTISNGVYDSINNLITFNVPNGTDSYTSLNWKLYGKIGNHKLYFTHPFQIAVYKNIHLPLWEDVPIGLHENSSNISLDDYTLDIGNNPYVSKEYFGPGVFFDINNNWVFSPEVANVGENVIYYRTNYKGCESTWADTIINVIGLGTSAAPKIDIPYTFSNTSSNDNSIIGLGKHYGGYYDYEGQWEYATGHYYDQYYMSFNYVCGGEKYELSILNPTANLVYEWNVYYHEELLTTGVGDFFTLQIPSNDSLVTNNTFQPINIEDADSSSTYSYIGYSGYISNYLGDVIKVKVRSKNVLGDYSNWSKYYLFGAVSSPELITQDIFCTETDLHEININEYSNNSAYISFNDLSNYRTISYEKNLQGDWINYDSIHNYTSPSAVKIDTITVIAKDSIKFYGFNEQLNEWKSIYNPFKSTVCYSEPQTYVFVRKPEFEVNFNEYDTITYGNAVKGEIVGSYFDDSTKYLWNWNDGSETYNEQVHWHFFNDLGSYSVNVDVIDSYGCSNSLYFDSLWFVPGVLALEEEIDEVEFSVYPNPTSESFKIKSNYSFDNVEVYNIQGILVSSFDYLSNYSYNISSLSSGVYTIKINGPIGKYMLKLIKK